MGIIKDIVDKVAPIAQERIKKEGIDIKQAVEEELIDRKSTRLNSSH